MERSEATVYRSVGAIKISLGKYVPKFIKSNSPTGRSKYGYYELDTNKWEIEEVFI